MGLLFEVHPVPHLRPALAGFARSGFVVLAEVGRDGVLLAGPGGGPRADVLVQVDDIELELGAGGAYAVGDVDAFRRTQDDRDWVVEPCSGPLGRYAALRSRAGLPHRFLDTTTCAPAMAGFLPRG